MTITLVPNPMPAAAATFRLFFREDAPAADRTCALVAMLGWFEQGEIDSPMMRAFMDIAEAPDEVLVGAALAHYRAAGGPRWPDNKPTPERIADALRRAAVAEDVATALTDSAIAAAHLASDFRISWVAYGGREMQRRYLLLFGTDPEASAWFPGAFLREAKKAHSDTIAEGAALAIALWRRPELSPRLACTLGTACLGALPDCDVTSLVAHAAAAPGMDMGPGLLQNFATAALDLERLAIWTAATDALAAIAERVTEAPDQRVRAALRVLLSAGHARHLPFPYASLVDRIVALMAAPPFHGNADLRLNLKRRGIDPDTLQPTRRS